jgi:hypothetical protein
MSGIRFRASEIQKPLCAASIKQESRNGQRHDITPIKLADEVMLNSKKQICNVTTPPYIRRMEKKLMHWGKG